MTYSRLQKFVATRWTDTSGKDGGSVTILLFSELHKLDVQYRCVVAGMTARVCLIPTTNPTANPIANPTANPTTIPTAISTAIPIANPSANPTAIPSANRAWFLGDHLSAIISQNPPPQKKALHRALHYVLCPCLLGADWYMQSHVVIASSGRCHGDRVGGSNRGAAGRTF